MAVSGADVGLIGEATIEVSWGVAVPWYSAFQSVNIGIGGMKKWHIKSNNMIQSGYYSKGQRVLYTVLKNQR